jgi:hypothetical protein
MTSSLKIKPNHTISNHYPKQTTALVRDGYDAEETDAMRRLMEGRKHDLQIYVKSGEYFTTLATTLDGISDHPELQQIVHDLMYLQQHYRIVKK